MMQVDVPDNGIVVAIVPDMESDTFTANLYLNLDIQRLQDAKDNEYHAHCMFMQVLGRGLADLAAEDTELVLEAGRESMKKQKLFEFANVVQLST